MESRRSDDSFVLRVYHYKCPARFERIFEEIFGYISAIAPGAQTRRDNFSQGPVSSRLERLESSCLCHQRKSTSFLQGGDLRTRPPIFRKQTATLHIRPPEVAKQ